VVTLTRRHPHRYRQMAGPARAPFGPNRAAMASLPRHVVYRAHGPDLDRPPRAPRGNPVTVDQSRGWRGAGRGSTATLVPSGTPAATFPGRRPKFRTYSLDRRCQPPPDLRVRTSSQVRQGWHAPKSARCAAPLGVSSRRVGWLATQRL
jgi:hypothetical protein